MNEPAQMTSKPRLKLVALPCLTDNVAWLLHDAHHAWAVDPTLAAPIADYIAAHDLILADILITHHHHDHVGGIAGLAPLCQGRIIGASQRILGLSENLTAPASFRLSFCGAQVHMLPTFGHTFDHVSYYLPDALDVSLLFCGDTIFSAGCGRLFDGTIEQLFETFTRLMALPDDTIIACAHEYTAANLAYALAIDSTHTPTLVHNNQVKYTLSHGGMSLPTTLHLEKQINPYMRCIEFEAAWVLKLTEFAQRRGVLSPKIQTPLDAFTLCRLLKNTF